jgi:plasmid stability protein
MLIYMRTTLLLPDDLYREVKRVAADDGRTVTSFVEEALRAALARRDERPADRPPYRVAPVGGRGPQPGVDLTDSSALTDLMEGR